MDSAFQFYIPLKKGTSADNLMGIASTVSIDRDGERMSSTALEEMRQAIVSRGVNLFGNHEHQWENTLGVIKEAHIENNQLMIKTTLDNPETNPKVRMLTEKMKRGINLGLSVGGTVTKERWEYDKSVNRKVKVIDGVKLFEISVVGIPSNADSFLSLPDAIGKSAKQILINKRANELKMTLGKSPMHDQIAGWIKRGDTKESIENRLMDGYGKSKEEAHDLYTDAAMSSAASRNKNAPEEVEDLKALDEMAKAIFMRSFNDLNAGEKDEIMAITGIAPGQKPEHKATVDQTQPKGQSAGEQSILKGLTIKEKYDRSKAKNKLSSSMEYMPLENTAYDPMAQQQAPDKSNNPNGVNEEEPEVLKENPAEKDFQSATKDRLSNKLFNKPYSQLSEAEKEEVDHAANETTKAENSKEEPVRDCGWCGEELPPYSEWKWVLCPKCKIKEEEKSVSKEAHVFGANNNEALAARYNDMIQPNLEVRKLESTQNYMSAENTRQDIFTKCKEVK